MARDPGDAQFEDFDRKDVYWRCENALKQSSTRNVVIEFDKETAKAAVDLNDVSMRRFLKANSTKKDCTRWINIWGPEHQQNVIKALSDQYSFTPRLLGIMSSKHSPTRSSMQQDGRSQDKIPVKPRFRSAQLQRWDSEKNSHELQSKLRDPLSDLNHYNVVSEVWHYFSVDWNARCKRAPAI